VAREKAAQTMFEHRVAKLSSLCVATFLGPKLLAGSEVSRDWAGGHQKPKVTSDTK
jgi:hypothetical protein